MNRFRFWICMLLIFCLAVSHGWLIYQNTKKIRSLWEVQKAQTDVIALIVEDYDGLDR